MKISKTRFLNLSRCPSFSAFLEIYQNKDEAIVMVDETIEDIMGEEARVKKQELFESMYEAGENDEPVSIIDKPTDEQMEVMLPYYQMIEVLTARAVKAKFKGMVEFSLNTFRQRRMETDYLGYHFYCFLDGYQENDDCIRIIESKATTSKKFVDLMYTIDKDKQSIFEKTPEGILILRSNVEHPKYLKKVEDLTKKYGDAGRYVYDLAYQRFCFEASHPDNKKKVKYYLSVLNHEYVFDGRYDKDNKPIYSDDIIQLIDLTDTTKEMQEFIISDINQMIENLNNMDASKEKVALGDWCQRKDTRQCLMYPFCSKKIKGVPDKNSLFVYMYNNHGFLIDGVVTSPISLINEGITKALEISENSLTRLNNIIQRKVIESGEPYIYKERIKRGIESLKYPLYHLDFESFNCPLPRFAGEKAYTQSLFQYSIHIEEEPMICNEHYTFLSPDHKDRREELIINMLDVIKDDGGSIISYNKAFEMTRIKEVAKIFPQYAKRLLNLNTRMFDLLNLLRGGKDFHKSLGYKDDVEGINYYNEKMNGSFSIKKVLPCFTNLSYVGMDIANGIDALVTYAEFPTMSPEVFEFKYQKLIEYCKQDTYAMVLILGALRKVVGL